MISRVRLCIALRGCSALWLEKSTIPVHLHSAVIQLVVVSVVLAMSQLGSKSFLCIGTPPIGGKSSPWFGGRGARMDNVSTLSLLAFPLTRFDSG